MNKIVRVLVPVIFCFFVLACNLGNLSSTPQEAEQASPAVSASETPTQVSDAAQPASSLEPCSLITAADAEAILAKPVSAPNTMNGACTYSNAKDSLYMISVAAAQGQEANGILQGQAMMLGLGGGQLDETSMNKLKTSAEALDYKGFFTELVTAAEGAPTLKARLVEGGGSDVVYWAWITAQSRRQGAFVAVRGQTLVNINLIVADTQSEESMLADSTSLADNIFKLLPSQFTLAIPVPPTQQPQVIPTITIAPPEKTIIGQWERRSSEITEHFIIQEDGRYSIEARNNSTNEIVTGTNGTITFDKNNIYFVDKDNHKTTESYYLDNNGDLLVINNNVGKAWTRIK